MIGLTAGGAFALPALKKEMIVKKLRLTPAASVTPMDDGILLQSDLGSYQLQGRDIRVFVTDVMPMLEQNKTLEEICAALADYDNDSIASVINVLKECGLVEEISESADVPPWPAHERFIRQWKSEEANDGGLHQKRVLITGLEPWAIKAADELATVGIAHLHLIDHGVITEDDLLFHRAFSDRHLGMNRAEALKDTLQACTAWCDVTIETDITLSDTGVFEPQRDDTWDLVMITLGNEAQYAIKAISEYVQHKGLTALYGAVDGLESHVGPLVVPGETACWNCLRLRKIGASENPALSHVLENSALENQLSNRARSVLSPMVSVNGHQLAMEAIKLLSGFTRSDLSNHVRIQNLVTGESEQHQIIPVPWCDVCGGPDHLTSPPDLTGRLNHLNNAEEVRALFKGWVDPVTGVIRNLTGHQAGLPDFPVTASANVSSYTQGQFDPRHAGQVGSGKGLDEVSAHISAVGEALERYSAARYNPGSLKYASISQLEGEYLDPDHTVLYSRKQYMSPGFPFSPWKRKQKIHWAEGVWLGTRQPVWVPALLSYFNFACPYEEQFSQVSSNGLAAGQDFDDAAVRACYELIERDAMMLTWYGQLPCQRLKPDSQYDGKMRVMMDELTAQGVELELYLLDVGLHIPTVVCLALGDGVITPAVSVALSCHGDINVAMRKALLEQGHVMPYLRYLMSSLPHRPQYSHEVQSLEDHAAFYFNKDKLPAFDFMRQPESEAIDVSDWQWKPVHTMAQLKERLDEAGVRIAVVDVTSPDIKLSPFRVARAIGPHLQPIHFGEQFRRFDNPRLRRLLKGRPVNTYPHPIA